MFDKIKSEINKTNLLKESSLPEDIPHKLQLF